MKKKVLIAEDNPANQELLTELLTVWGYDVVQAFAEGASGYVTKNASPDELVRALQAVAAGGTYVTPDLAGHLLNGTFRLTERQRAVLRLVGMGLTNADVARELCLTEKTVENYLAAIRGACGLLNRPRSELTRFAIESDPGCLLEPQQHGEGPDGCGVRRGRRRAGKERPSKRSR